MVCTVAHFLRDAVTICISAQLLLIPLILSSFSALPVYTIIANLTVGPILDFIIILGLIASFFIMCVPRLGLPYYME